MRYIKTNKRKPLLKQLQLLKERFLTTVEGKVMALQLIVILLSLSGIIQSFIIWQLRQDVTQLQDSALVIFDSLKIVRERLDAIADIFKQTIPLSFN